MPLQNSCIVWIIPSSLTSSHSFSLPELQPHQPPSFSSFAVSFARNFFFQSICFSSFRSHHKLCHFKTLSLNVVHKEPFFLLTFSLVPTILFRYVILFITIIAICYGSRNVIYQVLCCVSWSLEGTYYLEMNDCLT